MAVALTTFHMTWMYCIIIAVHALSEQICPPNIMHNCSCYDIDDSHGIRCINTSLTTIPDDLPSLNEMRFEGNTIPVITDTISTYIGLRTLLLNNNGIAHIDDGAFKYIPHLDTLSMSDNKLSALTPDVFEGLNHLTILHLANNPLHVLHANLFNRDTFPNLEVLTLSGCFIHDIDAKCFVGVSQLTIINLTNNALEQPPHFTGASRLQMIDLSYNQIKTLSKDNLQRYPFDGLRSILDLYLNHNMLKSLGADAFHGLTALRKLHINNNILRTIDADTFFNLKQLDIIDLSHNQIQVLSSDQLNTQSMQKIVLHDNAWTCSCETGWMTTNAKVLQFNLKSQMICSDPPSVAGDSMWKANIHVFDCPDPHSGFHSNTLGLAVGLLVTLMFCILGAGLLYKLVVKKRMRRQPLSTISSSYKRVHDSRELIYNEA